MLPPSRRLISVALITTLIGGLDGCLQVDNVSGPPPAQTDVDGTGTVVSITDGDTLRLEVDGRELRVRLLGIDTPEVYPEIECFGPEAELALAALAPPGSTLGFTYDRDPRDRFDRELMYLFTADGDLINLELVTQGFAEAVLFEPNDRYWNELQAAERAAQRAGLGLWGSC
ncbi:MAG: thermonuclease family protein [Microcella sp.]|nr:thermonuclease family protein [Microcella sp.]